MNKLLQVDSFQLNIAKTAVFPEKLIEFVSYSVMLIEVIAIILLVFKKKHGLVFCFYMFLSFTFYIIYLRFFDKYEVCGCGGVLNGLSFPIHLLINLSLISISLFLAKNEN